MDLKAFEQTVRAALDQARDALARIEEEARERGEFPLMMETSRVYAEFCLHAREYVTGALLNRPFPRRFAQRVRGLRDRLSAFSEVVQRLGLQPTPQDLERLAEAAEKLPEHL